MKLMRMMQTLAFVVTLLMMIDMVLAQTSHPVQSAATTSTAQVSSAPSQARNVPVPAAIQEDAFFKFYATNLRSIFFSGCLTLSSFLLAASTFIVINLKKEVYDSDWYQVRVSNAKAGTTVYGPLRRLSRLLIANIGIAMLASVLQVTVGIFCETKFGAIICIIAAGAAIVLLFFTLLLIGLNLRDWFDNMESQAKAKGANKSNIKPPDVRPY